MKMRKLAELISVATREKTGKPLRWWTFGESLGVFVGLYHEDVASDKRRRDLLFPLRCLFKIVLQKGLTVDLKSLQVLAVW